MGCGPDVENLFDVVITSQDANVWSFPTHCSKCDTFTIYMVIILFKLLFVLASFFRIKVRFQVDLHGLLVIVSATHF